MPSQVLPYFFLPWKKKSVKLLQQWHSHISIANKYWCIDVYYIFTIYRCVAWPFTQTFFLFEESWKTIQLPSMKTGMKVIYTILSIYPPCQKNPETLTNKSASQLPQPSILLMCTTNDSKFMEFNSSKMDRVSHLPKVPISCTKNSERL